MWYEFYDNIYFLISVFFFIIVFSFLVFLKKHNDKAVKFFPFSLKKKLIKKRNCFFFVKKFLFKN